MQTRVVVTAVAPERAVDAPAQRLLYVGSEVVAYIEIGAPAYENVELAAMRVWKKGTVVPSVGVVEPSLAKSCRYAAAEPSGLTHWNDCKINGVVKFVMRTGPPIVGAYRACERFPLGNGTPYPV